MTVARRRLPRRFCEDRGTGRTAEHARAIGSSRGASALVQDASETLSPARAEARRDLDLIRELGALVGAQPGRQRLERTRPLSDFLGEGQRQFPGNRSRRGRLSDQGGETLRLQEVLESGRGLGL